jgi:hypothetical protein
MREQESSAAKPCCGKRGLGPGMTAADHDHVEFSWELHGEERGE